MKFFLIYFFVWVDIQLKKNVMALIWHFLNLKDMSSTIQIMLRKIVLVFLIRITCLSNILEAESVQLFAHLLQTRTSDHTHQSRGNWKRFSVLFSFSTKVCRGGRSICKSSPLSAPPPASQGQQLLLSLLLPHSPLRPPKLWLYNHFLTAPPSAFYLCASYLQPLTVFLQVYIAFPVKKASSSY